MLFEAKKSRLCFAAASSVVFVLSTLSPAWGATSPQTIQGGQSPTVSEQRASDADAQHSVNLTGV